MPLANLRPASRQAILTILMTISHSNRVNSALASKARIFRAFLLLTDVGGWLGMKHNRGVHEWGMLLSVSVLVMCAVLVSHAQAQPAKKAQAAAPVSQPHTPKQVMSQHTDDLRALMQALYELHPEELAKSTQVGAREMTEWVFDGKAGWKFDAIRRTQQDQAIALIFDPEYTSDHILALVVGLETLLFHAYGGKNEYDIPAQIDDQAVAQAVCQVQALQKRLQDHAAQAGVFDQAASQQLIQQTLQTIIQRSSGNHASQRAANFNC
jgi:hypothetical protein